MGLQQLVKACSQGDLEVVKALLKQGVDPREQDEEGCSPLMVCCLRPWN